MSLDKIVNSPQAQALIYRLAAQIASGMTIGPKGDQGEPGAPGAPGLSGTAAGAISPPAKLKAEVIGFFDPATEGEGAIVDTEKHVIYKDVDTFEDRIETCAEQWNDNNVKLLIPVCIRGDREV